MPKLLATLAILLLSASALADEPAVSPAEKYMHTGAYDEGETVLLLQLDAHPADDEARFGLGMLQFLRAVETVGQTLYEYGASANLIAEPFPRLPIPKNENPSVVSYQELRRVLQVFQADLMRADETLAGVTDPDVKLKIRLAQVSFDFTKTGKQRVTMAEIFSKLNGGRPLFQKANPDIRIHFDRGDVAWLRAYCHLMASLVEATLALELNTGFNRWLGDVFPKRELVDEHAPVADNLNWVSLAEPFRLRRLRLHLVALAELNHETWKNIRAEKDDDFEWLAHPKQTDQLGLPLTDQQIDAWLKAMEEMEGVFKGDKLMPRGLVLYFVNPPPEGKSLSIRKIFDDPPRDFFNLERISKNGFDPKYFEDEKGRQPLDVNAFLRAFNLFGGPFGIAQAVRMN